MERLLIRERRGLEDAPGATAAAVVVFDNAPAMLRKLRSRKRGSPLGCIALGTHPKICKARGSSMRPGARSVRRVPDAPALLVPEPEPAGPPAAEGPAMTDFRSMEDEIETLTMELERNQVLRRMKLLVTAVEYDKIISESINSWSLYSFPPPV